MSFEKEEMFFIKRNSNWDDGIYLDRILPSFSDYNLLKIKDKIKYGRKKSYKCVFSQISEIHDGYFRWHLNSSDTYEEPPDYFEKWVSHTILVNLHKKGIIEKTTQKDVAKILLNGSRNA